MKIPAHILGLLVAGVVAPTVAGCAVDTEPAPPQPSSVDAKLQQANEDEPEQPAQPTSTAPEQPAAPPPVDETAPTNDDPCPPCGMG